MNLRETTIKTFKVRSDNLTHYRPRDADPDREFAVEHPVSFRTDKHPAGFDHQCAHFHVGLHSLLGSLGGLRISSAAEKLSCGRTQIEDGNTPVPLGLICVVYRYPADGKNTQSSASPVKVLGQGPRTVAIVPIESFESNYRGSRFRRIGRLFFL